MVYRRLITVWAFHWKRDQRMVYIHFVWFVYLFAIEVGVSSEGAPGSGEGEHGEGDWDGNIHSDLQDKQKVQHDFTLYSTTIRYNPMHR